MNILYEDEDIIVVVKPPGLATQTAGISKKDVVSELKSYLYRSKGIKNPYVGVIHRLDQPVEGLLVFALNENSAKILSKQINDNVIKKKYIAVVEGIIESTEQETLIDNICKDGKSNKAYIVKDKTKDSKKAELKYKKLDEDTKQGITLLEIELITGRFHQIRCQLSNAGFPIVNDEKYGAKASEDISKRQSIALCASNLFLKHPKTKKNMKFRMDYKYSDFLDKYR